MITRENAREMQLAAAKKRVAANNRRRLTRLLAESEIENLDFIGRTLLRVRLQLEKLYEEFMSESDPMKLDRLAAAQSRLAEQERVLAGRPNPGSYRPKATPQKQVIDMNPLADSHLLEAETTQHLVFPDVLPLNNTTSQSDTSDSIPETPEG